MNRKGFTLIELMAVIVILGLLLSVTVPTISSAITNVRNRSYIVLEGNLLDAAKVYHDSNPYLYDDASINVTMDELFEGGFIDMMYDLKDQDSQCSGFVDIVKNSEFEYKVDYKACLICANYESDYCY